MNTLLNMHSSLDQFEIRNSLTLDAPILGLSVLFKSLELSQPIVTITVSTTFNTDNILVNIINSSCSYINMCSLFNNNIVLLYDTAIELRRIPLPNYSCLSNTVLSNNYQLGHTHQLGYYAMLAYQIFYKMWNCPLLIGVLGYLLHLLYIIFRNKVFFFLYILSMFIIRVDALLIERKVLSNLNVNLILMTLGNIIFIVFNTIFDYISIKVNLRNKIFVNKIFTHILCGLVYFLNIISGVFASNGTYFYLSNSKFKDIGLLSSILFSFIFSYFWFTLSVASVIESKDFVNSIFRSITECIGFNSLFWLTYAVWQFWMDSIYNYNIWALLFIIPFILFSVVTIWLEIKGFTAVRPWTLIYPVFYILMFSSGAFFTNSLFYTYMSLNHKMVVTYIRYI